MIFSRGEADVYARGGGEPVAALERTTHLAIGAHQDDLEIFAYHGIAECFDREDRNFTGVVVTDGSGSPRSGPFAGMTDEQMRAVRRDEQRRAAGIGRYGLMIQLAHPSKAVKGGESTEVIDDLEAILGRCRADVLYVHNPVDRHDTHVGVLLRTLEAARRIPRERRPRRVLGCEVWRDLDWLPDDRRVSLPVVQHGTLAAELLAIFESQIVGGKRYDLAVQGRRRAHATFSDSHAVDAAEGIILAMDLTALFHDDTASVLQVVAAHIDALKEDAISRLRRTGAG